LRPAGLYIKTKQNKTNKISYNSPETNDNNKNKINKQTKAKKTPTSAVGSTKYRGTLNEMDFLCLFCSISYTTKVRGKPLNSFHDPMEGKKHSLSNTVPENGMKLRVILAQY
jgi:hypothetical protein